MATQFIPTIAEKDYAAFRRQIVNGDLPDTYQKWLGVVSRIRGDNVSRGRISKPIDVDPAEYARYCGSLGGEPNLQSLKHFAQEKGTGIKY